MLNLAESSDSAAGEQKPDVSLMISCLSVTQSDYYYQYTECDSTGSRWRVAIPLNPGSCSDLPPPTRGTDCCRSRLHVHVHVRVCASSPRVDPSLLLLQLSPVRLACFWR